jgi:hypothetical protein
LIETIDAELDDELDDELEEDPEDPQPARIAAAQIGAVRHDSSLVMPDSTAPAPARINQATR